MAVAYAEHSALTGRIPADQLAELDADDTKRAREYASRLVEKAVRNDRFRLDEDTQLPSDEQIADAFREAVADQVAFWVQVGVDLSTISFGYNGQAEPQVASSSINGATVQWTPGSTEALVEFSLGQLAPVALDHLTRIGLGSAAVGRVYG